MNAFVLIGKTIYFNYMRWVANRKHNLTGKQYHVLPTTHGFYKIVHNRWVRAYNKVVRNKNIKGHDHFDILSMAVYSTPVKRREKSIIDKLSGV